LKGNNRICPRNGKESEVFESLKKEKMIGGDVLEKINDDLNISRTLGKEILWTSSNLFADSDSHV
jgi:hypothetical protein